MGYSLQCNHESDWSSVGPGNEQIMDLIGHRIVLAI